MVTVPSLEPGSPVDTLDDARQATQSLCLPLAQTCRFKLPKIYSLAVLGARRLDLKHSYFQLSQSLCLKTCIQPSRHASAVER